MTQDNASKFTDWFEAAEENSQDARTKSERDRDYYDNKQWTAEAIKEVEERGQEVVTINRIKKKVDALLGIEKSQRSDPKAFPRNPEDEDAAHAATDALRYVIENNNYDQLRSNYWKNLLIEGMGIVKVSIREGKRGIEVLIKRIAWDRYFYDPRSSEPDFSDARYQGEVIWMDFEEAKKKWPGKANILTTLMDSTNTDTYEDKPRFDNWTDKGEKRVRIIQTRWKDSDGKWHITASTKGGILKDGLSPYLDEDGNPESDIVAVSAHVDRDNNRYGEIRPLISPQDEINQRRSKALHLMSVRQVRVDPHANINAETVRAELAKPDGIFEGRKDDFEILATGDMAAAQFNLLQEAKNEIDATGSNPSLQGKEDQGLSGRAMLAQQQAGLVELAPMLDRKRDMDIRVYRMVWNRVKQYWTEERWIRVTDDQDKPRFVGLNRPMTIETQMVKEFGEGAAERVSPEFLQLPANENGKQIIENNVGEMDIDIIIDEGPDTITLQSEEFEALSKIPGIPLDILIEASSLKSKDRLLERMRGEGEEIDEEQAALEQQMQQRAMELQFRGQEAEVAKTEAEAIDKQASATERESKTVLNLANAQKTG